MTEAQFKATFLTSVMYSALQQVYAGACSIGRTSIRVMKRELWHNRRHDGSSTSSIHCTVIAAGQAIAALCESACIRVRGRVQALARAHEESGRGEA